MKLIQPSKLAVLACLFGLAAAENVRAGQATFDFSTDPTQDPSIVINGGNDTPWQSTGGNPGGFLALLYSIGSTAETVVFPDIDKGQTVSAFTFETDLRIGNAQGNAGRPADGFSVNFARDTDPVLANLPTSADPNNFAAPGQPEDGTATGIAIGFDTWQGNTLPDDPAGDIEGIIVRVDNKTILKQPMPTRNGACDDPTSMQTGPYNDAYWTNGGDPHDPQAWAGLCWAHLKVDLDETGKLTVTWKNKVILDHFQTTYFPSVGRLVLAGRTGGANENTHFDNIKITTVTAASPLLTALSGSPGGFTAQLTDATGAAVDANSISVKLNGNAVTTTNTKSGAVSTLSYSSTTFLPSGSTNTVEITYKDASGKSYTATRTYVTPAYTVLPADFAATASAVDKTKPGFDVRVYQTSTADGTQPNDLTWTEEQLAGLHGKNIATPNTDGTYVYPEPGVINYDATGTGSNGNFTPDVQMPGFPGTDANQPTDNSAAEITTYLEFPAAGSYTLGVNSDDGFRVSSSKNPHDVAGVVLGQYNGGRGASDTLFNVAVPQAGIYPIRLIWENGGGGANVEFFSVNPDGTKVLINDPAAPGALKAYRVGPSGGPYVSSLRTAPNNVSVALTDATDATVDQSSVQLSVNGTAVTGNVAKSGNTTTITYAPTTPFTSGSAQKLTLSYKAGGATVTRDLNFTTETYATIPASLAVSSVDKTKPGFNVRVYQSTNTNPNTVVWTEEQLAGLHGPNIATPNTDGSYNYVETGVINYDATSDSGSNGNFTPDVRMPGFPGTNPDLPTDNNALEVTTILEFPTAGLYTMGVNSDDGFAVSTPWLPTTNSASILLGEFNGGRGSADTLFDFYVSAPGDYPFRLLWENAGGGANVEWFTVTTNGTKVLINDPNTPGSIKAFRVGATNNPPPSSASFTTVAKASGNNLTLAWSGTATLQSADSVNGPWTDVPGAQSPATVPTTGTAKFYRLK